MSAIIYAAKSTADKRGSIGTQLEDGRALAAAEGLDVVGEYHDESASAFKGNRGHGLERAMAHAETAGVLIVQHSDRLARGDGKRAKHLVEYALWALQHDVTIRSVQDDQTFGDLLYAVVTGQRNHEDSSRKSKAVRDGLARRKERGAPVGAMPLGYRAEPTIVGSEVVTTRVVDPEETAVLERIWTMLENGATYGAVTRALNADGILTKRGGVWQVRTLRKVAENTVYLGEGGYPRILERERWERIQATRRRMDPAAVRARTGGRRAKEKRLLDGLAFCAECGSPMYRRVLASGVHLICRHARQATGLCHAPAIPAEIVERRVVDDLSDFGLEVESWLAERAAEQNAERTKLEAQAADLRAEAARVESRIARTRAERDEALDAGQDDVAAYALKELARYDEDHCEITMRIAEAEARAAEWSVEPDIQAQLARYESIAAAVGAKLKKACGITEMNAILRRLLGGVYMFHEGCTTSLYFRLADEEQIPFCDYPAEPVTTPDMTFVYRCLTAIVPDAG